MNMRCGAESWFGSTARSLVLMGVIAVAMAACSPAPPPLQADRLWVGEHIITFDDAHADATAVAIEGERIVWVGRREDWRGDARETVELGDRALLPGFIDAHGHLSFSARTANLANVASPPVGAVGDIASLQAILRSYISERGIAVGEWVVGIGYDDSLIEEQRHPDRDDLDAVSGAHPIALIHVSGHLATANSMALERAGISKDTPDPPGGVIRRRAGGEPNGVLEETATEAVRFTVMGGGDLSAADIHAALDVYASHGITTVQDGAASVAELERFAEVADTDGLALDVEVYLAAMDPEFHMPEGLALGEYQNRVKLGGVKMFLDGSPQGKTAYLSEPYFVPPPGLDAEYRGYPMVPQDFVDAQVARFAGAGMPMLVHCNGDAAAEMLLDALDNAREGAPLGDHRTVMIHAQTVREDQIDRMAALGVVPSYFSAHTFYWGDWHRDSVLGPERARRISPTRSTLARNMPFTVHNDAPVVPPDMIRLVWATTNRLTRSGQVLGEAQRLDTLEALRAVTANAAYQSFEECCKGTLTPGKQADLVVLSRNPLSMPAAELLDLEVVETVSRGATVFRALN
ncbi:MAG: amidohydrolase [Gammaproteobacteria bacterium]|nr:amidohydrolase [Gammaproteobacteria bacterium]